MHFGQGHFNQGHFGQQHFPGGGYNPVGGTVTVSVPWKRGGLPLANFALDYWVIDSADELVQSGSCVTNSAGNQVTDIPVAYSGQPLLFVVNNLGPDMITSGKFHGQAVVIAP